MLIKIIKIGCVYCSAQHMISSSWKVEVLWNSFNAHISFSSSQTWYQSLVYYDMGYFHVCIKVYVL